MKKLINKIANFLGLKVIFNSDKNYPTSLTATFKTPISTGEPGIIKEETPKFMSPFPTEVQRTYVSTPEGIIPLHRPNPSDNIPLAYRGTHASVAASYIGQTDGILDFDPVGMVRRQIFSDISIDLRARYATFLSKNMELFAEFAEFAYQAKNTGFEKYSAKAIMERVRWERDLHSEGEQFKVNNSYTSLMARTLVSLRPEDFENFFELRGKR